MTVVNVIYILRILWKQTNKVCILTYRLSRQGRTESILRFGQEKKIAPFPPPPPKKKRRKLNEKKRFIDHKIYHIKL